MKLTTSVNILASEFKIDHKGEVLLMGSCFSQNIRIKLEESKFKVSKNSFGIIYNPISIAQNINRLNNGNLYTNQDIYSYKDKKVVNFSNQNSSPATGENEFLNLENENLKKDLSTFNQVKTIVLTFGTAWVYQWKGTQQVVANCHKIPDTFFTNRLLSVSEIVKAYEPIIAQMAEKNIVFTISPVRHVKGGLYENTLSKSTLHLAIKELVNNYSNCYYFPAYELVVDELRDYRFYKEDMVHPTDQAVNYVWTKFSEAYFSKETKYLNGDIEKIRLASFHKPFDYKSEDHQAFIKKQLEVMENLTTQHPFLDFMEEKNRLNQHK